MNFRWVFSFVEVNVLVANYYMDWIMVEYDTYEGYKLYGHWYFKLGMYICIAL